MVTENICNDIELVKGISTAFDLCGCCTTCSDCGKYVKYDNIPEEARVVGNFICSDCFKIA